MEITVYQLIPTVLNLLLGGGLLVAILKYRIDSRKLSIEETEEQAARHASDLDKALGFVTQQRDDLREEISRCFRRIDKLEKEVQGQRIRADLDPFPSWIFSLEGRFLHVNREFEKLFLEHEGRDYRDIIGEIPEGVWPGPFCRVVRNLNDLAKSVPDGRARATVALVVNNEDRQVTVQIFAARIRGAIVAYAGYITNVDVAGEMMG